MADLDLVPLWEAHCRYEFETRDVDATMSTMVAEPYVNHIPHHDRWRRLRELAAFLRAPFHRGEPSRLSPPPRQPHGRGELPCRRVHRPLHAHHSDGLHAARH